MIAALSRLSRLFLVYHLKTSDSKNISNGAARLKAAKDKAADGEFLIAVLSSQKRLALNGPLSLGGTL